MNPLKQAAASFWAQWNQLDKKARIAFAVGFGVLLLAVAGGVIGAVSNKRSTVSGGPPGSVGGSLEKDCGRFIPCDKEERDGLAVSKVWCRREGLHVVVHLILRNRLPRSVTASIVPRYELKGHGRYGTEFGSEQAVYVGPRSTPNSFLLDAGVPKASRLVNVRTVGGAVDVVRREFPVPRKVPISNCSPRLLGIQAGIVPGLNYVLERSGPNPKVYGRLTDRRESYLRDLRIIASHVWCKWRDNDVVVHLTLRHPRTPHSLTDYITVVPRYRVRGSPIVHGDYLGAEKDVSIDPRKVETKDVVVIAGTPKDVVFKRLPLSKCEPYYD